MNARFVNNRALEVHHFHPVDIEPIDSGPRQERAELRWVLSDDLEVLLVR